MFCDNQNIKRRYCPVDDHRANGAVERCIQSVKRRLGTMLCEKGGNVEAALTAILSSIRKSKHAITKKSPHFMHFGRAANTPLSILHDKVAISDKGHLKRSMLTKEQKKEDFYSADRLKVILPGQTSEEGRLRFPPAITEKLSF